MNEEKIVRCAGCGVEMANPSYGQPHLRQWFYYCPTCRKNRENNEGEDDE